MGPCSISILPFLDASQSCGEQVWEKKGNEVLGREVIHKLGKEIWF